jgi:hypothetical protein
MTPEPRGRLLRHGTTRRRAEAILRDGPNPNFLEPGSQEKAGRFSAAPLEGPFPVGTPEFYAERKAALFPDEGGPAVLEIEVPEVIAQRTDDTGGEYRFLPGYGLTELLQAWPSLPKRIL